MESDSGCDDATSQGSRAPVQASKPLQSIGQKKIVGLKFEGSVKATVRPRNSLGAEKQKGII